MLFKKTEYTELFNSSWRCTMYELTRSKRTRRYAGHRLCSSKNVFLSLKISFSADLYVSWTTLFFLIYRGKDPRPQTYDFSSEINSLQKLPFLSWTYCEHFICSLTRQRYCGGGLVWNSLVLTSLEGKIILLTQFLGK